MEKSYYFSKIFLIFSEENYVNLHKSLCKFPASVMGTDEPGERQNHKLLHNVIYHKMEPLARFFILQAAKKGEKNEKSRKENAMKMMKGTGEAGWRPEVT